VTLQQGRQVTARFEAQAAPGRVTLSINKDGGFEGWGGACAHEKGTRCTVRVDGDLEVSFKFLPKR
jgi:nitrite reductase/ring-hydroxylating ferredoxin subunit